MSTFARYLSSALSRISLAGPVESPGTTARTPPLLSSPRTFARGLILSTSPYLKGTVADPKVSLTPATAADASNTSTGSGSYTFDVSLISDTSTSSSCSEVDGLPTPQRCSDRDDLFSPRSRQSYSLFHATSTPSPPQRVGLGIFGVPRKDGKPGNFDGLGLVGVHGSFNPRNPFITLDEDEDDDDDDGYSSPTPLHSHKHDRKESNEDEDDGELSETFLRELVFTWEADPQHTRVLSTIAECDDEDELEFQEAVRRKTNPISITERFLSPESYSPVPMSPSSSFGSCSMPSLPSALPTPSPLSLDVTTNVDAPVHLSLASPPKAKVSSGIRNTDRYVNRSKLPSTVAPSRVRVITRSKDLSESKEGDGDKAKCAPRKKKVVPKGVWRV